MVAFVLVHGAFLGGWCWQRLTPILRAAGCEAYAPTLTGLGERVHLLRPEIGLDTHIRDVSGVLEYEDLDEVILVGHSYAGLVVEGVVQRAAERVAHVVYLDAMFPIDHLRSCADLIRELHPPAWAAFDQRIRGEGDGWRIPPPAEEHPFNLPEAEARWVRPRLTATPLQCWEQPLPTGSGARPAPRTYVRTPRPGGGNFFAPFADRARAEGWGYRELPAGHLAMVTAPGQLAELLVAVARAV